MEKSDRFSNRLRSFLLLTALFFLITACFTPSGEQNTPFTVYLVDNGGSCEPCSQVRFAAKRTFESAAAEIPGIPHLKKVDTQSDELKNRLKKCTVFDRELLITFSRGGKVRAWKTVSMEPAVLAPAETEQFIRSAADSLIQFADSCARLK